MKLEYYFEWNITTVALIGTLLIILSCIIIRYLKKRKLKKTHHRRRISIGSQENELIELNLKIYLPQYYLNRNGKCLKNKEYLRLRRCIYFE
jgi:hypothetical protein